MKISILGTGKIAQEVISVLRAEAPEIELTSIFAHSKGSEDKARELARTFAIEHVYTDYDELLSHDDADFIYVGLVNTAHYEFAKKALLHGRNIIVEKPFTTHYSEAQELAELARKKSLWLFEAVTTLHFPNYKLVQTLIKDIAPVRLIQCNYSQYSSRYDRYLRGDVAPAFNPQLGGGSQNDLNIYNVNAVVGLMGKPEKTTYYPNKGFNGVDTSGILVMEYPDAKAVCTSAKDSSSPSFIIIQGEKGTIEIPIPPNEIGKVTATIHGVTTEHQKNRYQSRLVHEFKDFEDMWERNDYKSMNHYLDLSLDVMETMEMLRP